MTHATIIQTLLERAAQSPDQVGFTIVDLDGNVADVTYEQLLRRSLGVATQLRSRGLRQGDRLVICLPTSEALLLTLYGTMLAGGVCVPVYPPLAAREIGRFKAQLRAVTRVAQPCGAVVAPAARLHVAALLAEYGEDLFTLSAAELRDDDPSEPAASLPGDLAFIQFTSGTTRRPRGVAITHAALMANIRGLVAGLGLSESDVSVSWLPPYHDMGLVGHILTPIACRARQVLMPPSRFLFKPERWLRLISEQRATQTTAPNSGYAMCARRVGRDRTAELDLSSLCCALNGAELVQPATHQRFGEAFGDCGFDVRTFRPVYGLAEATLAATLGPPGGPLVDHIDRKAMTTHGRAEQVPAETPGAQAFVSVGGPLADHDIAVVEPESGEPCEQRQVGEIRLRGPSVMQGYFNDPQATREALQDGWLTTGDLGYLADGQLYVTGRIKELIIKAGRNFLPTDIEAACSEDPRLRPGRTVAFGLPNERSGTEDLVVVAEVRAAAFIDDQNLSRNVGAAVTERVGVRPDRVDLIAPGLLPKTTSGKLQRAKVRGVYAAGKALEPPAERPGHTWAEQAQSATRWASARLRQLLGWQ